MKFTKSYLLSGKLIESLDKQLKEKGEEINGYMEKHNIQLGDQQVGLQNTYYYLLRIRTLPKREYENLFSVGVGSSVK